MVIYLAEAIGFAFMIWMLVDCARRNGSYLWFFLIMSFPVVGALAYFFVEKTDESDWRWLTELFRRPPSIEELRYEYQRNACEINRLRLAEALRASGDISGARDLFSELLTFDPTSREALFGLGVCTLAEGDAANAVAHLSKVVAADRAFLDYEAWLMLANAYWMDGQRDRCAAELRELLTTTARLRHAVALARCERDLGREEEARRLLVRALEDHKFAPDYVKRANRRWLKEATALLREIVT